MLLIHYPSTSRLSTHGLLGVHRSGINGGVQGEEHGKRRRGQGQICGCGQVRHLIKAADKIVDVVKDMEGRLELLSKA